MISKIEKLIYSYNVPFRWIISGETAAELIPVLRLDEICDTCDSIKDKEIEKLGKENKELKKLVEFWRTEARSLTLKTALAAKAVPLEKMIDEVTSTPEGERAWEKAWKDQFDEWYELMKQGKMSRIKYYRLINGIDQLTLSKKLSTAQPNISRIERPGYNVPIKTLKELAKIFGVKMEDLIGE